MRFLSKLAAVVLLSLAGLSARAELVIEITQGIDNPTAIAVVPFAWKSGGTAPEDIAGVVQSDLSRSGQFAPVDRADMLSFPSTQQEVFYRDWRALQSGYLLIGLPANRCPECGREFDPAEYGEDMHDAISSMSDGANRLE